jgi:hypothetical protein
MNSDIIKRLEQIERIYKDDPLIVLARLDSGEEVELTMREMLEKNGQFIRVISGSSTEDLKLFLNAVKEEAWLKLEERTHEENGIIEQ